MPLFDSHFGRLTWPPRGPAEPLGTTEELEEAEKLMSFMASARLRLDSRPFDQESEEKSSKGSY